MSRLDPNRPTLTQLRPLIHAIYAKPMGGAGCCLHIVTDDRNVDDGSVDHCIESARERGHDDCLEAAQMLRQMSKTQRSKARG